MIPIVEPLFMVLQSESYLFWQRTCILYKYWLFTWVIDQTICPRDGMAKVNYCPRP